MPGKGFLEIRENTEINMALFDHSDRIGNQCFIASREESNSVEHPTKRSGGVCTPAEAKDINPIFRFINFSSKTDRRPLHCQKSRSQTLDRLCAFTICQFS